MRLHILATAVAATAAVLLLLQVSAAGTTGKEPLLGGWSPIKNLSDPYVREIAEFAVTTHNNEAKTGLALTKVVKGETQVVAGTNYRLVFEVKDGAGTKTFEAVVWDKPWEHFRRLTSFKAAPGSV